MRTGILILSLLCGGCFSQKAEPIKTLSEAEKKFVSLCAEEYKLYVVPRTIENTLWIYVPLDYTIYELNYPQNRPETAEQAKVERQQVILYFDGKFIDLSTTKDGNKEVNTAFSVGEERSNTGFLTSIGREKASKDNAFHFEYDILSAPKAAQNEHAIPTPQQTERFIIDQMNLITALGRVYFEVDEPQTMPEFLVLVMTQVSKGFDEKIIISFQDLKQLVSEALPQEEFSLRVLQEPSGNPNAINDREGKHLDIKPVIWGEFLTKQISNRVYFKYHQSDFPPTEGPEDEILKIIAGVKNYYQFEKFSRVTLKNLRDETNFDFSPQQINTFAPKP